MGRGDGDAVFGEEAGGGEVRDPSRQERRPVTAVVGEQAGPQLRLQLALSNEVIGVVERHDHDDQPSPGVERPHPLIPRHAGVIVNHP